jgi:hypothetical protein
MQSEEIIARMMGWRCFRLGWANQKDLKLKDKVEQSQATLIKMRIVSLSGIQSSPADVSESRPRPHNRDPRDSNLTSHPISSPNPSRISTLQTSRNDGDADMAFIPRKRLEMTAFPARARWLLPVYSGPSTTVP